MAFQQNPQNASGGISFSHEDTLQLLLGQQAITNGYLQDTTNYLPQQSATAFPFRQGNTSTYPNRYTESAFTQPIPDLDFGPPNVHAEISAKLGEILAKLGEILAKQGEIAAKQDEVVAKQDEAKQDLFSLRVQSDQIDSRYHQLVLQQSEFQDCIMASLAAMKEYVERHRQWSFAFKSAVQSQIRGRNSSDDGQAGSEGSTVETQGA